MINTKTVLAHLVVLMSVVVLARCHGRLWDPPSRSSMWRRGYNVSVNINDNELSCGGFTNHWVTYRGLCGVCGDPYQQNPRDNEAGGKYARGIITETYQSGTTIDVTIDVTANHGGHFEFKLCPTNDPSVRVTQDCLDRHKLTVQSPNGDEDDRYIIRNRHEYGYIHVPLKLPPELTCRQCVLQWKWVTETRWNCNQTFFCKKGIGPQEEFYGCADVAITRDGKALPPVAGVEMQQKAALPSTNQPTTLATTQHPTVNFPRNSQIHKYLNLKPRVAQAVKSPFNPYRKAFKQIQENPGSPDRLVLERPSDTLSSYFQKLALEAVLKYFESRGDNYTVESDRCRASTTFSKTPGLHSWCQHTCADPVDRCPLRMCYCAFVISVDREDEGNRAKQRRLSQGLFDISNTLDTGESLIQSQPAENGQNVPLYQNLRRGPLPWNEDKQRKSNQIKTIPFLSEFVRPVMKQESLVVDTVMTGKSVVQTTDPSRTVSLLPTSIGNEIVAPARLVCTASDTYSHNVSMKKWCMRNCGFGFCPPSVCTCT